MKITAINSNDRKIYLKTQDLKKQNKIGYINSSVSGYDNSDFLNAYKSLNSISFKAKLNKYNLQKRPELNYRIDTLGEYKMLGLNATQYTNLAQGDKAALKHLVKAARILDDVYLRQDSIHNIPFRNFLNKQVEKGNKSAKMSLKLFNAQKGINAKDLNGEMVNLAVGHTVKDGKGFYPEDLTKEEFHSILLKMLDDGQVKEVEKILNQRSIVKRVGSKLKAVDYTEFFKKEFQAAADEITLAAQKSTNKDFNKFLLLQAKALLINNPQFDADADKVWAKLQNTPLEFTITRESYDDRMTPSVMENNILKEKLQQLGITPYAKDNIGARVGIVNKKGTEYILLTKQYLPLFAKKMPYNDEYTQVITIDNPNQTMVDVDLVDITGQTGAYRGGISIASNLPNNDKLAIKQGGGRRNVYHIQNRNAKYSNNIKERLNAVLDKSLHKYFDVNYLHDFTILHENLHSLGPKENLQQLGLYKNILEEHKADVGAYSMLDLLRKEGVYTSLDQKKLITSTLVAYALKGADMDNAHRKRTVMQFNYFIQNGGITVDEKGKMHIDFDNVIELSKRMLKKVIRLQLDKDSQKAKEYIDKYAVWTDELARIAQNLKKADTVTNNIVVTPLADALASK